MSDDRLAQARAEAYLHRKRFDRSSDYGLGFMDGGVWADANPKPHTITHDDMGAAYAAFMDAEGHPVRRFIVALKAIGIGVEDNDE